MSLKSLCIVNNNSLGLCVLKKKKKRNTALIHARFIFLCIVKVFENIEVFLWLLVLWTVKIPRKAKTCIVLALQMSA